MLLFMRENDDSRLKATMTTTGGTPTLADLSYKLHSNLEPSYLVSLILRLPYVCALSLLFLD